MANGNNATIGFEKQIWDAACVLWGHIPAAEYRKVIVGLIFLRYISNAFEKRYQELVAEGDGLESAYAFMPDNSAVLNSGIARALMLNADYAGNKVAEKVNYIGAFCKTK